MGNSIGMPVPTEFLRGVLGVMALGCAYLAGRSLMAFRRGWQKKISGVYSWIIRMTVCLAGIAFRHEVDLVDIMVWTLSAALFGLGCRGYRT